MQPLRLNKKFLTLVNLCAPADNSSNGEILFHGIIGMVVFLTLWSDFISSVLFVIGYKKYPLEVVLGSMLQSAAVSASILGMVTVYVKSHRLKDIFAIYKQIYDECGSGTTGMLEKTEKFCIKITNILVIRYVICYCSIGFTLTIINITSCFMKDKYIDRQCLYTPYLHILPWKDDTLTGWFFGWMTSLWMALTYFFINCVFLSFFLSTRFMFGAIRRQFDVIINQINETSAKKSNFNQYATDVMHQTIGVHNLVKRLFGEMSSVYEGVVFAQLVCGALFMAASLFQMDTAIHHLDFTLYAYMNAVCISTTNLYLYCYGGASITAVCLKYSDTVFAMDWYIMPVHLQKYLILMIRSGNQRLVFSGYGILKLNLETFTSILKTVMSYYLMFKTLTE